METRERKGTDMIETVNLDWNADWVAVLVFCFFFFMNKQLIRRASPVAQWSRISLQCRRHLSLGREMATHSSILAWEIPWTERPVGLQSVGL